MQFPDALTVSAPQVRGRRLLTFAVLVSFCCLVLLASVVTLPDVIFRVVLLIVFLLTGFAVLKNVSLSYFIFLASYPLIPSHLGQLGLREFSAAEYLFLSFAFWWSAGKIIARKSDFPAPTIQGLFLYQFGYLALSSFGFLFVGALLFSKIFLLQSLDHWNPFLPLTAGDLFASLHALLTHAEGMLFLFITLDLVDSRSKIQKAAETIFYAAAGVSLLGVFQYLFRFRLLDFWVKENPNLIRINSTMDDPNSLGAYLAVAFCIGLYAVSSQSLIKRVCNFAALAVILAALLMSASRSAVGAAFVVAIVFPYLLEFAGQLVRPQEQVIGRAIGKIAITATIALALLVGIAAYKNYSTEKPSNWIEFLLTSANPQRPVDAILKGRTALWHTAIRLFLRNPVVGGGLGSFFYQVSNRPFDFPELRIAENAHNYYLQVLAETGIVGLLLWLAILLTILAPAFRKLRLHEPDSETFRVYGFIAAILVYLLTSFTGHPLLLAKMQFLFWTIAGLLLISTGVLEGRRIPYIRPLLGFISIVIVVLFPWQMISAARSSKLSAYEIGYYSWERDSAKRLFRWTKDRGMSDLLVEGNTLSFEIRQINKKFLQKPWPVDIYLDDRLAERVFLNDSRWTPLEYKIQDRQGSRVRFMIKPAATYSPVVGGVIDPRQLGVQITPFRWKCPEISQPMLQGIVRDEGIFRISAFPLKDYIDPQNMKVTALNGRQLSRNAALSSIFFSSLSFAPLYEAQFSNPEFVIDSGTNLVIKKDFPSGNAIFRITGETSCSGSAIPALFVLRNGRQMLKIPFLCSTPTDYYFEMPLGGGQNELTFSAWDGLSEITKRTDTRIQIRDVRIARAPRSGKDWLRPGWFETPDAAGEVLLDSTHSSPVALQQTGDSFDAEKDWNPGVASLIITAAASTAGKDLPRLGIYTAGRVGAIAIEPGGIHQYRVEIPIVGRQRLQIVFENDYYDASRKEDRNVFLYDVRMEHPPSVVVMDTIDDFLLSGPPCYIFSGGDGPAGNLLQ